VLSCKSSELEHEVLVEALADSCTQLEAAKELTSESSVLENVPEYLRSRFLVAAASTTHA
jgi:hypothetical protein